MQIVQLDIALNRSVGVKEMTMNFQIIPPFIQDTTNNESTNSMSLVDNLLYTCGTYPPKFSQYNLTKHATQFSRHVECDILKFKVLLDDKFALLMSNRNIQFHTLSKCIYSTKLPSIATHMSYSRFDNNLYFAGNDLMAINLTSGQFIPGFEHHFTRILSMDKHDGHLLIALGGETLNRGLLSIADSRSGVIASLETDFISAVQFSKDGFQLAAGDVDGNINVYDIRQLKPLHRIVHQYASPIKEIKSINNSSSWASLCKHQLKISRNGKTECTIEPDYSLNDFVHIPDSGMFIMGGDSTELTTAYVNDIGPAPKFALFADQFFDSNTSSKTEYEHFKFITKPELCKLGLDQFIGSDLLKPVMHGFYCHHRLIDTAKHVMLDYNSYRNKELKDKVDSKLENTTNTTDQRFSGLDNNPEFAVDTNAEEYKRIKPTASKKQDLIKIGKLKRNFKNESSDDEEQVEEQVLELPTFEDQLQTNDIRGNFVYEFKSVENK